MVVETVLSMRRLKQGSRRTWVNLHACLVLIIAVFNMLVQWDGLPVEHDGNIRLWITDFSL
jgi:hypothetical protein